MTMRDRLHIHADSREKKFSPRANKRINEVLDVTEEDKKKEVEKSKETA